MNPPASNVTNARLILSWIRPDIPPDFDNVSGGLYKSFGNFHEFNVKHMYNLYWDIVEVIQWFLLDCMSESGKLSSAIYKSFAYNSHLVLTFVTCCVGMDRV